MALADQLSATFAALADPTRRAILERLAGGEATVGELAEPFDMQLPAVSKHLKVLQKAGLVEQGRQAQWRPCRLRPQPLQEVVTWMGQYREFLGDSYDRLDTYLHDLQNNQKEQDHDETGAGQRDHDRRRRERRDDDRAGL